MPHGGSERVRVRCEAEHVNVAARQVEAKRGRAGDARIERGKHLQHAALSECFLVRSTIRGCLAFPAHARLWSSPEPSKAVPRGTGVVDGMPRVAMAEVILDES